MARNLLTALPVIVACLLLQALVVAQCLRWYGSLRRRARIDPAVSTDVLLLSVVMLLTLIGNCLQMAIWAGLFMVLGEFEDYATAVYHSAVNFAALGYGDIVMSPRWRLLGAIEATNGILMIGVSTATVTAAVIDVLKRTQAGEHRQ